MFDYSDSSFHCYFDTDYAIRRDSARHDLRLGMRAAETAGAGSRFALSSGGTAQTPVRLLIFAPEGAGAAISLEIIDCTRLACFMNLASISVSGLAVNLGVLSGPTCGVQTVIRVRGEERFTN